MGGLNSTVSDRDSAIDWSSTWLTRCRIGGALQSCRPHSWDCIRPTSNLAPTKQLLEVLVQDMGHPPAFPFLRLGHLRGQHLQLAGSFLRHGRAFGDAPFQGLVEAPSA